MERARLLVVDDDASIRETLELHFGGLGHDVATASSAEEALGLLASFDPMLVVTDVRMGGMEADQALAHFVDRVLRRRPRHPQPEHGPDGQRPAADAALLDGQAR